MLNCLLLSVFVTDHESLILTGQEHYALLVLHLRLNLLFIKSVNLLSLKIKVDSDQVYKLFNWVDLPHLKGLLWANHLFQLATHVCRRLKLLHRDKTAKLLGQVWDGLQVRNFPVQETAHVSHIREFKTKQLAI